MAKSGQEKTGKGGVGFGSGALTMSPTIKDALCIAELKAVQKRRRYRKKDMLRHEKHLEHLWHWKWDSLLLPEYWPPYKRESIRQTKDEKNTSDSLLRGNKPEKLYHIKRPPLPPIPIKSSETIGWLSTCKEHSFDMFTTRSRTPKKIRFQDEQYGLLRMQKYLQKPQESFLESSLPTPKIKYKIKPILC